jgi:hypothetical protein
MSLPARGGVDDLGGVPVVRGADADSVDVRAGEDLAVVDGGVAGAGRGVVVIDLLAGVLPARGVAVADGDDADVGVLEERAEVVAVLHAHADESEAELAVGALGAACGRCEGGPP